jgi:hypothetical protein
MMRPLTSTAALERLWAAIDTTLDTHGTTAAFTGKLDGDQSSFVRDVVVRPGGGQGGAGLWGSAGAMRSRRGALSSQLPRGRYD